MATIDREQELQDVLDREQLTQPLSKLLSEVKERFPSGDQRRLAEHWLTASIARATCELDVATDLQLAKQLIDALVLIPHGVGRKRWPDFKTFVPDAVADDSVGIADALTAYKKHKSGSVGAGRLATLSGHLSRFEQHCGNITVERAASSQNLLDYKEALEQSTLARQTQKAMLQSAVGFVRWLFEVERIDAMPRVIGSRALMISATQQQPKEANEDDVRALLKLDGIARALVLLGLNCGMTRADFRVIKSPEGQYLEHRRPKTRHHSNTPTVTYKLWPETLDALPLLDGINFDVTSAVSRRLNLACKKAGIDYLAQKMMRKASATVLRNSEHSGLTEHFLGHSPSSVANRHYASVRQSRFDSAVEYLRSCWIT